MNNITWSKKSSATHDNGERNMCWRVGLPVENGTYLVTTDKGVVKLFVCNTTESLQHFNFTDEGKIIAYMKLPKPYKPD